MTIPVEATTVECPIELCAALVGASCIQQRWGRRETRPPHPSRQAKAERLAATTVVPAATKDPT